MEKEIQTVGEQFRPRATSLSPVPLQAKPVGRSPTSYLRAKEPAAVHSLVSAFNRPVMQEIDNDDFLEDQRKLVLIGGNSAS